MLGDLERIDEAYDQAERLREHGLFVSAHALYTAVLVAWPDFAPAHAGLAWCKIRLGDLKGAVDCLRQAQALDPGNSDYGRSLAKAEALLGGRSSSMGPADPDGEEENP